MRGKAFRPAVIARWHRITPACAGKSCPLPRRTVSVRDHPRVCGEKRPDWKNEVELVGSPPRVRGKGEQTARPHYHMRITPACAGKRGHGRQSGRSAGDHPRVCGEKWCSCWSVGCCPGSPPRVRGKACGNVCDRNRHGITPACAGKRFVHGPVGVLTGDHPRVCGEKLMQMQLPGLQPGSPPRVRGKGRYHRAQYSLPGITPACAGKRRALPRSQPALGDHPRVCGEK